MSYIRIDVGGDVDLDDCKALETWLRRPGEHRPKALSVTAKDTRYANEARKYLSKLQEDHSGIAVVVTSPLVRAALNVMLRLTTSEGQVRLFEDEVRALAWLEQQPLLARYEGPG